MPVLIACAGLVLAVALAAGALPAGGFWWDALAAVGFCTATVLAFLGWDSESPAGNPRLRLHRNLAIAASGLATAHGAGYLLLDRTVVEYLLPAAPAYMLAGSAAWLLLLGMTITSLPGPRRRSYPGFAAFRRWHRGLFLTLIAASGWHVLGTGFSLGQRWQQVLAAGCLGALPLAAYWRRRRLRPLPLTRAPSHTTAADSAALWLCLALLLGAGAFAAIKQLACATCPPP